MTDWTHQRLQADLYSRRRRRKATEAWSEIEIPGTKGGRFDVFEARHHDARAATTFVGFEVKATRPDLESDLETGKWKRYLPACDQLYFAVPKDLAPLDVIPSQAGVLVRTESTWRVGRKPEGGHRTVTDLDIWRRLALREFWTPLEAPRTRLERMEEYARMRDLSHLISRRVRGHIQDEYRKLHKGRQRYEQVESRIQHLEDIEARLGQAPDLLSAISTLVLHAGRTISPGFQYRHTFDQAIDVIRETKQ